MTSVQVGAPWDPGAYAPDTPATIMGEGMTSVNPQHFNGFTAVDTVLRSDDFMDDIYNRWWWFDDWIEHLMIGAGGSAKTACEGDSGSPLVVSRGGHPVEVGVHSFGWGECSEAGGFTELSNAQLAWVAKKVPSITESWGHCTQPSGSPGQAHVHYGSFYPTAEMDGPFYWKIDCVGIPTAPQNPPPAPAPTPRPEPPPDPCAKNCPRPLS
jgi:hypothetical protein